MSSLSHPSLSSFSPVSPVSLAPARPGRRFHAPPSWSELAAGLRSYRNGLIALLCLLTVALVASALPFTAGSQLAMRTIFFSGLAFASAVMAFGAFCFAERSSSPGITVTRFAAITFVVAAGFFLTAAIGATAGSALIIRDTLGTGIALAFVSCFLLTISVGRTARELGNGLITAAAARSKASFLVATVASLVVLGVAPSIALAAGAALCGAALFHALLVAQALTEYIEQNSGRLEARRIVPPRAVRPLIHAHRQPVETHTGRDAFGRAPTAVSIADEIAIDISRANTIVDQRSLARG